MDDQAKSNAFASDDKGVDLGDTLNADTESPQYSTSTLLQLARTLQVERDELILDTGETPRQKPKRQASDADAKLEAERPQVHFKRIEDEPAEERAAKAWRVALLARQVMPD